MDQARLPKYKSLDMDSNDQQNSVVTESTTTTKLQQQSGTTKPVETKSSNEKKIKNSKSQHEKMPKLSLRFDNMSHWIQFDDPNEKRKGFRCKKEGCGQTTMAFCEKCNVHLCFVTGKKGRNCFREFHILSEN